MAGPSRVYKFLADQVVLKILKETFEEGVIKRLGVSVCGCRQHAELNGIIIGLTRTLLKHQHRSGWLSAKVGVVEHPFHLLSKWF